MATTEVRENEPILIPRFVQQETDIAGAVATRIKARSNLIVVGASRSPDYYLKNKPIEDISVFIAPQEPTYDIKALNVLMEDLANDIKGIRRTPTSLPEGDAAKSYAMLLGCLSFTEVVGTTTEVIDIHESPFILAESGIDKSQTGPTFILSETRRKTSLYVYPHEVLAKAAFRNSFNVDLKNGWIKLEWLERLKQGDDPFQRPSSPGVGYRLRQLIHPQ